MPASLDSDIDRLYQLPLEEFTSARNALASRLRGTRDSAAARVKALPKPSVSAWAVNQLYWRVRPDFETVVTAGDAVRIAQQRLLAGVADRNIQGATRERQRAVARAVRTIDGLCAKAGLTLSASIRQRVQQTLEAIATYGSDPSTPYDGRLSEDLALPGFEALASLAAMSPAATTSIPARSSGRGRAHSVGQPARQEQSSRQREAEERLVRARAALASADAEARVLRTAASRAAAALAEAEMRARQAREDVELARGTLTDAMVRATKAVDAVRAAKKLASNADAGVKRGAAALRAARTAVARLES